MTTKLQTSTEHHGIGQSGYTTGRSWPDVALERDIQVRHTMYPHGEDAQLGEDVATDERWTGRGGAEVADDEATESSPAGSSAPSAA